MGKKHNLNRYASQSRFKDYISNVHELRDDPNICKYGLQRKYLWS